VDKRAVDKRAAAGLQALVPYACIRAGPVALASYREGLSRQGFGQRPYRPAPTVEAAAQGWPGKDGP
jgi:hypothetical protein